MVGGVATLLSVIDSLSPSDLQTGGQAEGMVVLKRCNFSVVQVVPANNRNNPQTGLCQQPQTSPSLLSPVLLPLWSIYPLPVGYSFYIAALSFHLCRNTRDLALR